MNSSSALLDQLHKSAENLRKQSERPIRIMEFCGGHTHALVHSGLLSIIPDNIQMVHGPGCPVCVLPAHHIQAVIDLLEQPESSQALTVAVYGDLLRIPTLRGDSLFKAQARGRSIKMIYSPTEILRWAIDHPDHKYLFVAIGFETTAPATARLIQEAERLGLKNIFVYCLHVMTPPAVQAVMQGLDHQLRPQGIIGPGHVSLVTGMKLYEEFARRYEIPIVISGFEGEDLLMSLVMILQCLEEHKSGVFNQYTRALRPEGNVTAQKVLDDVFEVRPSFVWRGLGELTHSSYQLKSKWSAWDAEKNFHFQYRDVPEHPACRCAHILKGQETPKDCKLFMKACTPDRPMGSCMVSSEGACHAHYLSQGGLA